MIKTALLLASVAAPPTDSSAALVQRVEIVRTEFGIPHILAEDLKAMGFGLGYVQSEDFSVSIATALIESRGTLARHVGREALDADFVSREAHARAVETFSRLDPRTRDVYTGFAEGVNHYVRLHPDEFPDWVDADFTGVDALARDVQTWSRGDAARFVRGLMADEAGAELPPAPDEAEAENTFMLDGSNAWALHGSRTASGRTILLRNPHLSWATDADLLTRSLGSTYYEA
ncbi:MAG: hypothetical protein HKN73_12060, partial [Gemmatimonadetes bacterium]|nr:hypothetical protein [Gemmatimonadota bacterium]